MDSQFDSSVSLNRSSRSKSQSSTFQASSSLKLQLEIESKTIRDSDSVFCSTPLEDSENATLRDLFISGLEVKETECKAILDQNNQETKVLKKTSHKIFMNRRSLPAIRIDKLKAPNRECDPFVRIFNDESLKLHSDTKTLTRKKWIVLNVNNRHPNVKRRDVLKEILEGFPV